MLPAMTSNRLERLLSFCIPHAADPAAVACRTELVQREDGTRLCRVCLLAGVGMASFEALEHNLSEIASAHPDQTVIDLRKVPVPPTYLVQLLDTFIRTLKRNGGRVTMLLPPLETMPGGRALFTRSGSRPPFECAQS